VSRPTGFAGTEPGVSRQGGLIMARPFYWRVSNHTKRRRPLGTGTHETLIRKISGVPTGHVVHDHTSTRCWKHRAIFCDSSGSIPGPWIISTREWMDRMDGDWDGPILRLPINLPPEILSGFPKTPEPVVASSGDPTPQPSPRGVRSIPRDLCFPQAQL